MRDFLQNWLFPAYDAGAIDALDTGARGGPDPDSITLETYGT